MAYQTFDAKDQGKTPDALLRENWDKLLQQVGEPGRTTLLSFVRMSERDARQAGDAQGYERGKKEAAEAGEERTVSVAAAAGSGALLVGLIVGAVGHYAYHECALPEGLTMESVRQIQALPGWTQVARQPEVFEVRLSHLYCAQAPSSPSLNGCWTYPELGVITPAAPASTTGEPVLPAPTPEMTIPTSVEDATP